VPGRTVKTFDDWRFDGSMDELDAWWKENRPTFGAVAYGIDRDSMDWQSYRVIDAPPEQWQAWRRDDKPPTPNGSNRLSTIYGGDSVEGMNGTKYDVGIVWVPKFLIFNKYEKVPPHIQRVSDGGVYRMTVYWDRVDNRNKKWMKTYAKKGGVPQEYAVCVEKDSGKVRVLKMLIHEFRAIRRKRSRSRPQV
jgi:hypothetical protein